MTSIRGETELFPSTIGLHQETALNPSLQIDCKLTTSHI